MDKLQFLVLMYSMHGGDTQQEQRYIWNDCYADCDEEIVVAGAKCTP